MAERAAGVPAPALDEVGRRDGILRAAERRYRAVERTARIVLMAFVKSEVRPQRRQDDPHQPGMAQYAFILETDTAEFLDQDCIVELGQRAARMPQVGCAPPRGEQVGRPLMVCPDHCMGGFTGQQGAEAVAQKHERNILRQQDEFVGNLCGKGGEIGREGLGEPVDPARKLDSHQFRSGGQQAPPRGEE